MKFRILLILLISLLPPIKSNSQIFDDAFTYNYPVRMLMIDSLIKQSLKPIVLTNPDQYQIYTTELQRYAKKQRDKKALFYVEYLNFYFNIATHNQNESQILKKFEELYQEAEELEMVQIQSNLYTDLGYYYYGRQNPNYILYFEYLNKAYEIYKNLNVIQYPDKSYNLYSLALSYYEFGDYRVAISYAKEVELIKDGDNFVDLFTYNLIGMSYLKLNLPDSSRLYLRKTYKLADSFEKEKGLGWTGIALGNIGHSYYKEGKYDEAIPYYIQAIDICTKVQLWDNVSPFSSRLISSYVKTGKPEEAEKFISHAQMATNLDRDIHSYALYYNALADYYKFVGESKKAINYRDSAILYNDSIQVIFDRNLKVQVQLSNYKDKVASQQALYESEKSRQRIIRNSIIGFVILTLGIVYVFYNRQKKLLHNKTVLLKEIHHRVKNNLQIISSILDIQQRTLKEPRLDQAFMDAKNRINSMALVHQNLYEKENIGKMDAAEYFDQLFKIITNSYSPVNVSIELKKQVQGKLSIDTLVPIALIVNELLTNTYKYAFNQRNTGKIEFTLLVNDTSITMFYGDDGTGVTEESSLIKSKGLGGLIIKKFTQQLQGNYSVDTRSGGIKYSFNFKPLF